MGLLVAAVSGTEPFDLSGYDTSHFQTGTYNWPTAPSTSSTENVTTIGQFQSAVGNSNVLINVAAGTYTGNLDITGNDIDIVMSNSATLNGYVKMEPGGGSFVNRVRWTGGNINTGGVQAIGNYPWTGVYDILFKDVDIDGEVYLNRDFSTKRATRRVAFVECTIDGRTSGDDFTIYMQNDTTPHEDFIMANCKMYNAVNNCIRLQDVTRTVVVESAFNVGDESVGGFRFSNQCEDALVAGTAGKPTIISGLIHIDNGGSYCIIDSLWDHVTRYHDFQGMFLHGAQANTGVISNIIFYDIGGPRAVSGISPMTTGVSVPNTIDWDGTSHADDSSYGAQR